MELLVQIVHVGSIGVLDQRGNLLTANFNACIVLNLSGV